MTIEGLPFPKSCNWSFVEYTLTEDLYIEQWIVPAGTKVKLRTGRNFGWLLLAANQEDIRGFTIPRHLFKY